MISTFSTSRLPRIATRRATRRSGSPSTRPALDRLAAGLLALIVFMAVLAAPLTEHGHDLDDAHHHTCSACRLADVASGAEVPHEVDLGVPDRPTAHAPEGTSASISPRTAPDPLRPRAPPVA